VSDEGHEVKAFVFVHPQCIFEVLILVSIHKLLDVQNYHTLHSCNIHIQVGKYTVKQHLDPLYIIHHCILLHDIDEKKEEQQKVQGSMNSNIAVP
jgi:hypothetical protein